MTKTGFRTTHPYPYLWHVAAQQVVWCRRPAILFAYPDVFIKTLSVSAIQLV